MLGNEALKTLFQKKLQQDCQKKRAGREWDQRPGLGGGNTASLVGILLAAEESSPGADCQRSWEFRAGIWEVMDLALSPLSRSLSKDTSVISSPIQDSFFSETPSNSLAMGWKNRSVQNHLLLCPPAPQGCHPPNSTLLVCIYRLIKPNPSRTMFPKHSLITINQQADSAAAHPCEHLVNDGRRLPNGQLDPGW